MSKEDDKWVVCKIEVSLLISSCVPNSLGPSCVWPPISGIKQSEFINELKVTDVELLREGHTIIIL
jgi:hypothetical protein